MSGPTRTTIVAHPDGTVSLAGVIDEQAALLPILTYAHGAHLTIDLQGVTFMNSLGVRQWIALQADAKQRGINLQLVRVAESLVHQFNMIRATLGDAHVASFYAPFACDSCGHEASLLVDNSPELRKTLKLGNRPCPKCSHEMAFDDFPERYLEFLAHA